LAINFIDNEMRKITNFMVRIQALFLFFILYLK